MIGSKILPRVWVLGILVVFVMGNTSLPVEVESAHEQALTGTSPSQPSVLNALLDYAPFYTWHTFYGSISNDLGYAIAQDISGNLYLTGYSYASWTGPGGEAPKNPFSGETGYTDIFVLKLNSDGAYQWHTFYGSEYWDESFGIFVVGDGNVYVTGKSYATWNGPGGISPKHAHNNKYDIVVLKLDTNGNYLWHTFYGSANDDNGSDLAYGVFIGGTGLTVVGTSGGAWDGPGPTSPLHAHTGLSDLTILKLGPNGDYLWHTFYGSANLDYGHGLELDGSGGAIVTGQSYAGWNGPESEPPRNPYTGGTDINILKLSLSGNYVWHTFFGSSGSDTGHDLARDSSGIYITGYSDATWNGPGSIPPLHAYTGDSDMMVVKINSTGNYQWHTFYGSTSTDVANGVAVTQEGNLFIMGYGDASWNGPESAPPALPYTGEDDIVVLKLDTGGSYRWHAFRGSSHDDVGKTIIEKDLILTMAGNSGGTWLGTPEGGDPLHAYTGTVYQDVFVWKIDDRERLLLPGVYKDW